MNANCRKAVILMGHGSRVPDAGKGMEEIAKRLKMSGGYDIVETCYMSRLGPHFPEILEKCVKQGAGKVVLIPYFLHLGLHTRLDIPEMMKREAAKHPGVILVFGKSLGFDESLVGIVQKRIEESWNLADVRDLRLEPRDKYKLPPGDMEFVPMPPEEAKKFRMLHNHE
ncbi:MAG: hypothetical protein IEMM0002_0689 [bacterium]|nr:MAG: hypothetical protein IEMM0002_0689 [bacterium]